MVRKESKKGHQPCKSSLGRDVLISSCLKPLTGGQGQINSLRAEQRHFSLTVRQRGRVLWGRPLCMILITEAPTSKSKNSSNVVSELVLLCSKECFKQKE